MFRGNGGKRLEALTVAGFCSLAVIGALIALYAVGVLNGEQTERRQNYPHSHAETAKQKAARACIGADPNAVFECVISYVEASEETANTEQDLTAQQRAAWGALIAAFAGIASVFVSFIGLYWIKGTLDATRDAANQATIATGAMIRQNRISEAVQRPWVKISAKLISVEVIGRRAIVLDWSVKFENIGQMVAYNFQPVVKFIPMDDRYLEYVAAHMDEFPGKLDQIDVVLIPKDENIYKGKSTNGIEYLPWNMKDGQRKDCILMLVAMARYRLPEESDWRISMQGFAIAEALGTVDDCHFRYDFPDDLSINTMHIRKLGGSRAT